EGPVPAGCGVDALPVCPDDEPETVRAACFGVFGDATECPRAPGQRAAPVYANADGATPDGILNLNGNVAEWVFDWRASESFPRNTTDPVGVGCAAGYFNMRVGRGGHYATVSDRIDGVRRGEAQFPSARVPYLGFRCARTLSPAGLCDPAMPFMPDADGGGDRACVPNAHQCPPPGDPTDPTRPCIPRPGEVPDQLCAGPVFDDTNATDTDPCPSDQRVQTASCATGLDQFCTSGDVVACETYLLSRFSLVPAPGTERSQQARATVNALLQDTLAPNGGDTLWGLTLPPDFPRANGNWTASFGSITADPQGRLQWLGVGEPGACARTAVFEGLPVRTDPDGRGLAVCGAVAAGGGAIWSREVPVSVRFSALSLSPGLRAQGAAGRYRIQGGRLALHISRADAEASTLGDPTVRGITGLLSYFDLDPIDLCTVPLPYAPAVGCDIDAPVALEGCNPDTNTCDDADRCLGWILPMDFEAIRADQAACEGLVPGLYRCACPAP
ncbi:MAG: SUMF1/EgtB/PvdO family nonheme iron enzyme, partial [Myxococcales bacterium]|nr:SUMF1/EgtB/PvdO family nonheme iron enzyme [Myxococcales bacterium]